MTVFRQTGAQSSRTYFGGRSTGRPTPILSNTYSNRFNRSIGGRQRALSQQGSQLGRNLARSRNLSRASNATNLSRPLPRAATGGGGLGGAFGKVSNAAGLLSLLIAAPAIGRDLGNGAANLYLRARGLPVPLEPFDSYPPASEQPEIVSLNGVSAVDFANLPLGPDYRARVHRGTGPGPAPQGVVTFNPPYSVEIVSPGNGTFSNWNFVSYQPDGTRYDSGLNGMPSAFRWLTDGGVPKYWEIYFEDEQGQEVIPTYDNYPTGQPRNIAPAPESATPQDESKVIDGIEGLQDAQDAIQQGLDGAKEVVDGIQQDLTDKLTCNICDLVGGLGQPDLSGIMQALLEILDKLNPIYSQFVKIRVLNNLNQELSINSTEEGLYTASVTPSGGGVIQGSGLDFLQDIFGEIIEQIVSTLKPWESVIPHLMLDTDETLELPICSDDAENETPDARQARLRTIQGSAMSAIRQLLLFSNESLSRVNEEVCSQEVEVYTSETIETVGKILVTPPKLIVHFRKYLNGKWSAPKFCLTINHFPDDRQAAINPPIPSFNHGPYTSKLNYSDNSQFSVNCSSWEEGEIITKTVKQIIDPQYGNTAIYATSKWGKEIPIGQMEPRYCRFYPTGKLTDGYTWEVVFPS